MAKLKPIAFTVGIMLLIGAALCLYFSLRNLSSIRPASAYEDMGVHIFVPEEVYPVQRENHATGRQKRNYPRESPLSKDGEQRPKSGPYPLGGAGSLPLPQSGYTAAHRRSRGAFLLPQEFRHTLALCSQLQFLQLAVVVLVDHLLDRPESEQ